MSDSYFKYHTQAAVCKRCCARWCNMSKKVVVYFSHCLKDTHLQKL